MTPVSRERKNTDLEVMTHQFLQQLASLDVPEPDDAVVAGGEEPAPVRKEREPRGQSAERLQCHRLHREPRGRDLGAHRAAPSHRQQDRDGQQDCATGEQGKATMVRSGLQPQVASNKGAWFLYSTGSISADMDPLQRKILQSAPNALSVDDTDGYSFEFAEWRFNIRMSNTEPVVRLNVESRADEALMRQKTEEILAILDA